MDVNLLWLCLQVQDFCGSRTIRLMLFPDSEESVTQDRNIYNINNKTANGFCRNFCDNKGS